MDDNVKKAIMDFGVPEDLIEDLKEATDVELAEMMRKSCETHKANGVEWFESCSEQERGMLAQLICVATKTGYLQAGPSVIKIIGRLALLGLVDLEATHAEKNGGV